MEYAELVEIIGEEPVFETGLLIAGNANPREICHQLSRWKQVGKIHQLRRGLYCLAPPFGSSLGDYQTNRKSRKTEDTA